MTVSFEENRLTIDGRIVELEKPIREIVEFSDRVIVLFSPDTYTGEELGIDRNVPVVDRRGAMLWRIERSMSPTPGEPGRTSPFVALEIENRGGGEVVIVYDGMGACYDLDPDRGKLSDPVLTK